MEEGEEVEEEEGEGVEEEEEEEVTTPAAPPVEGRGRLLKDGKWCQEERMP